MAPLPSLRDQVVKSGDSATGVSVDDAANHIDLAFVRHCARAASPALGRECRALPPGIAIGVVDVNGPQWHLDEHKPGTAWSATSMIGDALERSARVQQRWWEGGSLAGPKRSNEV